MTETAQSMYRSTGDMGGTNSGAFPTAAEMRATKLASFAPQPLTKLVAHQDVSGQSRYKYFRRPIIPFMNAQPPEVLFAPVEVGAPAASAPRSAGARAEPLTKTVETQSDFRENETQTNPYTPAYVLQEGAAEPEVLTLTALTYGAATRGAQRGQDDRARAREARVRRVVASDDGRDLLGSAQEDDGRAGAHDRNVREEQILELQNEKLATFDADLRERAEAREAHWTSGSSTSGRSS